MQACEQLCGEISMVGMICSGMILKKLQMVNGVPRSTFQIIKNMVNIMLIYMLFGIMGIRIILPHRFLISAIRQQR